MVSRAWPYKIKPREWSSLLAFYEEVAQTSPDFEHLAAIVRSVVASGVSEQLAAITSMHDLLVALNPLGDEPHEVVVVRAPGSIHPPKSGEVVIEHLTHTGRDDVIARPVGESVGLFWRFVAEKFGVHRAAAI